MHEHDEPTDSTAAEEKPSKSARKRAMHHLQDLGETIAALRSEQIRSLQLPERLEKEVFELQRLKAREARRRQVQFIGKLMREVDADAIQTRIDALTASTTLQAARFKTAEQWRDRLLDPGNAALEDFCQQFPSADRTALTVLAEAARVDRLRGQNRGHGRQLFRAIFTLLS